MKEEDGAVPQELCPHGQLVSRDKAGQDTVLMKWNSSRQRVFCISGHSDPEFELNELLLCLI